MTPRAAGIGSPCSMNSHASRTATRPCQRVPHAWSNRHPRESCRSAPLQQAHGLRDSPAHERHSAPADVHRPHSRAIRHAPACHRPRKGPVPRCWSRSAIPGSRHSTHRADCGRRSYRIPGRRRRAATTVPVCDRLREVALRQGHALSGFHQLTVCERWPRASAGHEHPGHAARRITSLLHYVWLFVTRATLTATEIDHRALRLELAWRELRELEVPVTQQI